MYNYKMSVFRVSRKYKNVIVSVRNPRIFFFVSVRNLRIFFVSVRNLRIFLVSVRNLRLFLFHLDIKECVLVSVRNPRMFLYQSEIQECFGFVSVGNERRPPQRNMVLA